MEITSQSKLFDVLKEYPDLEDQIVHIAPPFKNLQNPVLRRTVGKLATLEKVAQIGGMNVGQLVNTLRRAVGQEEITGEATFVLTTETYQNKDDPDWIDGEPQFTINGTEMLQRGEVPLAKVNELFGILTPGRFILLLINFEPTPMIDAMLQQERRVFHKTNNDGDHHLVFIQ